MRAVFLLILLACSANAQTYGDFARRRARLCFSASAAFSPLDLSPVAWFKGDGYAVDSVLGRTANWVGSAGYVTGVNGQAFSLSNVNYLDGGAASTNWYNVAGTDPITVSAWVKPLATSASVTCFANQGTEHWIIGAANGKPRFYRFRTTGGFQYVEHTSAMSTNEWHHVVGQYASGTNHIWLDGVKVSAATTSTWLNNKPTTMFRIGKYTTETSVAHYADDVLVFLSALTDAQILQVYQWRQ